MDGHTGNSGLVLNGSRKTSALSISETFWGYVVGKGGQAQRRAAIGELAAITGCLFFGAASFGQWLIPGSAYAGDIFAVKVSGTIMFFVFSAQLYLIARRGLISEVQVDLKRQCVRLVRRNREDATTVMASYDFAEINSVYVKRSKSDFVADQMYMRPSSKRSPILIATGPAAELEPLLDRIQRDFRGQMATAPRSVQSRGHDGERPRARSAFATG
ncbi:MAG: hypothetical protein ACU0C9_13555 [Paracoccaceae bacterium]